MEEETILGQLEELARGLAVEIRYEVIKKEGSFYPGGLCLLRGSHVLIVNSKATTRDKIQAIAGALSRFDLSGQYLRPGLREYLDKFAGAPHPPSEDE